MSDNFAQTVKQQADIVKVIGEYVKLRKSGAQNYSGLCPFHKEKSPSFSVNATHGYFYCFGCHEKGDVFTFVQKLENVSFPEAVRSVAVKVGIPLPKREFHSAEEARDAGIRRQLLDIHEAATQWFEGNLKSPEAARAREYLTGRGVSAETIAKFRIGYAPDDFNAMREALGKHFNDEVMRASGLFSSKEQDDSGRPTGNLYSRFRKRITFPIANEQGRVIAFTARALETDDKTAKYINSPETPLYTKGTVLFNLDKAKAAMRSQDFALLVEGQMDCISVFMAGVQPVIATSGTAFTEAQVRLLSRFTKRVVVNFDPDTAGANATEKSLALLTEEEFEVKVVTLEGGLDPDRFVREQGIQAYANALRAAKPLGDYLIERARKLYPQQTPEAKVKAVNFLLPHIRRMPSVIQRNAFINDVAQKLGIDNALMQEEVRRAAAGRVESIRRPGVMEISETERTLLQALVRPAGDGARDHAAVEISMHPEWVEGFSAGTLMEKLASMEVEGTPLDAASSEPERAMLARVLEQEQPADADVFFVKVNGALHTIRKKWCERRRRELRTLIAESERKGDKETVRHLMEEDMQLARALRTL